jgi:hypothetical protein
MEVWQALALAFVMLTGGVEPESTSRCFIPVGVSEELEKSDAVFAGKVIAEEYPPLKTPTVPLDEDLQKLGEGDAPQQSTQQPSRPTDPNDPMPPPNMDYFVGSWTFEWNVPESPLGPAGKFKGKETYKKTSDGVYESEVEGAGPEGAFKGRATTNYNEKERQVTRSETGLFGVPLVKTGPIGGDLGGYYTIFWETQPVKKDGKTVKLKGKTLMLSPANYRLQVQISVDGGPYTNFGNPWFRKTEGK